eukprot:g14449.t1
MLVYLRSHVNDHGHDLEDFDVRELVLPFLRAFFPGVKFRYVQPRSRAHVSAGKARSLVLGLGEKEKPDVCVTSDGRKVNLSKMESVERAVSDELTVLEHGGGSGITGTLHCAAESERESLWSSSHRGPQGAKAEVIRGRPLCGDWKGRRKNNDHTRDHYVDVKHQFKEPSPSDGTSSQQHETHLRAMKFAHLCLHAHATIPRPFKRIAEDIDEATAKFYRLEKIPKSHLLTRHMLDVDREKHKGGKLAALFLAEMGRLVRLIARECFGIAHTERIYKEQESLLQFVQEERNAQLLCPACLARLVFALEIGGQQGLEERAQTLGNFLQQTALAVLEPVVGTLSKEHWQQHVAVRMRKFIRSQN